ncbi:hypothetical protein T492DRAFT_1061625 [Pavlovales sp. CCMP2436]|nr:hypothetical protein T492DRAFT_1061625 [Pavlovales sp. CCMP2436]
MALAGVAGVARAPDTTADRRGKACARACRGADGNGGDIGVAWRLPAARCLPAAAEVPEGPGRALDWPAGTSADAVAESPGGEAKPRASGTAGPTSLARGSSSRPESTRLAETAARAPCSAHRAASGALLPRRTSSRDGRARSSSASASAPARLIPHERRSSERSAGGDVSKTARESVDASASAELSASAALRERSSAASVGACAATSRPSSGAQLSSIPVERSESATSCVRAAVRAPSTLSSPAKCSRVPETSSARRVPRGSVPIAAVTRKTSEPRMCSRSETTVAGSIRLNSSAAARRRRRA